MATKKKVLDQYRDHITKVGRSPHTVKNYALDLAAFARWFEQTTGEDFDPRAVDPRDIQEYKGRLISQGLKPATINHRLIALKGFFRWAKQKGLVGDNPFDVLEKILVKEQKDTAPRWLNRKEQLALLRAVGSLGPAELERGGRRARHRRDGGRRRLYAADPGRPHRLRL